jgi:hypothetical protein
MVNTLRTAFGGLAASLLVATTALGSTNDVVSTNSTLTPVQSGVHVTDAPAIQGAKITSINFLPADNDYRVKLGIYFSAGDTNQYVLRKATTLSPSSWQDSTIAQNQSITNSVPARGQTVDAYESLDPDTQYFKVDRK